MVWLFGKTFLFHGSFLVGGVQDLPFSRLWILDCRQLVGPFGWGVGPSQGLYLLKAT
jgi:hypothetical protein